MKTKTNLWRLGLNHSRCSQSLTILGIAFSKRKIHFSCVCVLCGENEAKVFSYEQLQEEAILADYKDTVPVIDFTEKMAVEKRVN